MDSATTSKIFVHSKETEAPMAYINLNNVAAIGGNKIILNNGSCVNLTPEMQDNLLRALVIHESNTNQVWI